jgi:hypothetical protein
MPKVEFSKRGAMVTMSILGLLALCWYWGWQFGATALTDPDSCWLVAVGRLICQTHALPTNDPFSWTVGIDAPQALGLSPADYLPYQWFASVIFFCLFQGFGAASLVYLVTAFVFAAFFALPFALCFRLSQRFFLQAILCVLAVSAGSFHFPLRPELFSYLFLALLFTVLIPKILLSDSSASSASKNRPIVWGLAGLSLFCLWANLHSGFVMGLIVALCLTLPVVLSQNASVRTFLTFICGALLGTLLTPFQLRLYSYLPELFFAPTNKLNMELAPLSFGEIFSADYLPFLLLQVFFVASIVVNLLNKRLRAAPKSLFYLYWSLSALNLVAMIAADNCRRLIPFAVLIALAYFSVFLETGKNRECKSSSPKQLGFLLAICLLLALIGTSCSLTIFPAGIPQATFGFDVPVEGVKFLQKHRPAGNLLNDAQFGDVLIFEEGQKARVFIDTRFDLYGTKLVRDYFVMVNALDGYQNLLDKYKIDCVFLPPRARLTHRLSSDSSWRMIYQDKASLIFYRGEKH